MSVNPTSGDSKRSSSRMKQAQSNKTIRLRHLNIQNFKAFDKLEIDLPPPLMEDDSDIFIMGSKNGLGKTSFLEACFMLFLAGLTETDEFSFSHYVDFDLRRYVDMPIDFPDLMVRAGASEAIIEGSFAIRDKNANVIFSLQRDGTVKIKGERSAFQELVRNSRSRSTREMITRFILMLAGLNSDPIIVPPFLYFHSYRKVQEGNLELGMMVEGERLRRYRSRPGFDLPISTFKQVVLRSLMSRGELFESLDNSEAEAFDVLNRLNDLMKQFAGGSIEKVRPLPDNTIEFRVTPNNGGPSFTFDGLSSGQKEIISTLFLIWRYTEKQSGIVLIDEPELHLNAEWHRSFVRYLNELAPNNQYILASHSEDVFAAVDKDRRILLDLS